MRSILVLVAAYLGGIASHQWYLRWQCERSLARARAILAENGAVPDHGLGARTATELRRQHEQRVVRAEHGARWELAPSESPPPGASDLEVWDAFHRTCGLPRGGLVP
jgi:hypothetical protein